MRIHNDFRGWGWGPPRTLEAQGEKAGTGLRGCGRRREMAATPRRRTLTSSRNGDLRRKEVGRGRDDTFNTAHAFPLPLWAGATGVVGPHLRGGSMIFGYFRLPIAQRSGIFGTLRLESRERVPRTVRKFSELHRWISEWLQFERSWYPRLIVVSPVFLTQRLSL